MKSIRPALFKIVVFAAVIAAFSYVLVAILEPSSDRSSSSHTAVFTDASGLKERDGVRLAGVRVGYVTAVELVGSFAEVSFQLNGGVWVTERTQAAIRYQNLLGQRYVELIVPEHGTESTLMSVEDIPVSNTIPSFDVSTLFNGFKPVFDTLNAREINTLQSNLLRVAQGDGAGIAPVVEQIANLTEYGEQRSAIITNIVSSLGALSEQLRGRSTELVELIDKLGSIVDAFSKVSDRLRESLREVNVSLAPAVLLGEQLDRTYDNSYDDIFQRLLRDGGGEEGLDGAVLLKPLLDAVSVATRDVGASGSACSAGARPLPPTAEVVLLGQRLVVCQ